MKMSLTTALARVMQGVKARYNNQLTLMAAKAGTNPTNRAGGKINSVAIFGVVNLILVGENPTFIF